MKSAGRCLPRLLSWAIAVMIASACNSRAVREVGSDGGGLAHSPSDAAFESGTRDCGMEMGEADGGTRADAGTSVDAGPAPDAAQWGPLPYPVGDCFYLVPRGRTAMPAPIAWDDCPPALDGRHCKLMRNDWTASRPAFRDIRSTRVTFDPATGAPLIAFTKHAAPNPTGGRTGDLFVIAEVDGPVRNAIFLESSECGDCRPLYAFSMAEGVFSTDLQVASSCAPAMSHETHSFVEMVGDPIGRPVLRNTAPDSGAFLSHVCSRWIIERWVNRGYSAINRATLERYEIFRPGQDPDGLVPREITPLRDAAFFIVASDGNSGIMSWDPVAGTRPMLRWYGDFSRGSGNFATDGQDMVWTQGEGKPPGGSYGDYASTSIMTAPFATDPELLKSTARRLRSDPNGRLVGFSETFVVGCGLAAHRVGGDHSLLIVRLSDGFSWRLPDQPDFRWGQAFGITCDELFAEAVLETGSTIARLRLDSLGAPMPPD